MSHRQRPTHTAHFFHAVETGKTDRGGAPITTPEEYASASVRLTDEGQPVTQMAGGLVAAEEPIIACEVGGLVTADPGIREGHHVALDAPSVAFDPTAPRTGAWFEIQQLSVTFGRFKPPRGFEATLQEA